MRMHIYYEELTDMVMDTETSYDLLSASWGCRKAIGITQSKDRRRCDVMSQLTSEAEKKGEITFPFAFCSLRALSGLDGAHLQWEGQPTLLSPLIQMLI